LLFLKEKQAKEFSFQQCKESKQNISLSQKKVLFCPFLFKENDYPL